MVFIIKPKALDGYSDNDAGIISFLKDKGFEIECVHQYIYDWTNNTYRVWDGGDHVSVSVL